MSKQETINEVIDFLRSGGKSFTADFLRDHYQDKPFHWEVLATENPLLNPDTRIYTKEDL